MPDKRVLSAVVAALVVLAGYGAVTPSIALAASCQSTSANKFLGTGRGGSGLVGVYSEIQFVEKSLCTQGSTSVPSWSLSWISIDDGGQGSGLNIYQGGYAKCPPPTVPGSCPYNIGTSYYWVYYAREQSSDCGLAWNTGFIDLGNVFTGFHEFQISKVSGSYNFYIDHALKHQRTAFDLETCWPAIAQLEWKNEMLNNGDQGGGPLSEHQDFRNNQYKDGSGWHDANRTTSSLCEANSYPTHWYCRTSPIHANTLKAWDDRFP